MSMSMALRPRISEKAYGLSQQRNTYVFEVPTDSNKATIADAVALQFNVTVTDVNITNLKGKKTRRVRRGGRSTSGVRPDVKKAYVTLKTGDSITIFANEEDEAKDKSSKKDKK